MDETEKKIIQLIDSKREEIIDFARDVYHHGELGYKEFKTSEKFAKFLKALGMEVKEGLAITGVKGYINKEKEGNISLSLIGELDALLIPGHIWANPDTEAAHCCGHHAQLAGVIGAAIALSNPEISSQLDGQVVFFAVPAEEYGEIEFKNQLKEQGKIRYGGGKSELIRIGAFDDVDISLAHHTGKDPVCVGNGSNNGFVSKVIKYKGKAAHAAGAPQMGINALHAASLGLTALGLHRETFQDKDSVRIHPIITKGGNLVNVIPDEVIIETLVRASNVEAIKDASKKTDRAFQAGAYALGAGIEIETMPGYLPTIPAEADSQMFEAAVLAAGGSYEVSKADIAFHSGGSTDLGDLEHLKPVLNFRTGGMKGDTHAENFDIVDEELAYVVTAKIFALTAYGLLKNGAKEAKKIVSSYKPVFTKEEYIAYMEQSINKEYKEFSH